MVSDKREVITNHQRLGEDVVHMRLTAREIDCLIAALELADDAGAADWEPAMQSASALQARLSDLRRALG